MTIASSAAALVTAVEAYGEEIVTKLENQPYDLAFFYPGVLPSSVLLNRISPARTITLPINLPGARATAEAAATASTVLTIKKGTTLAGATTIGTITFAAGATVGTFSFAAEVALGATDNVYIVGPASADATLGDVSVTMPGTRGS